MDFIPQSTKDNVPTFKGARFSNDGAYMILDGYDDKGDLVHPNSTLYAWLAGVENPDQTIQFLLENSREYTKEEFLALERDVNSVWYKEPRGDV